MTKRLLFLLISLGFFGFTFAQEGADSASEEVVEVAADEDEAEPEEVVVTGSRIARSQYEVSQPIQIIYGEEYENRGYTNASDALFDLPGIGVTNSLTQGSGGAFGNQSDLSVGQAIANNFGLGSGRTLVLVNGRRFIGSTAPIGSGASGSAVDLNNIPSVMIDRVEVVNAGGSAVYGSDAIAGVINYILKDDFEGANASLIYDDYAGLSSDISFQYAMGGNFANGRGNIVVNFQYDEVGTVFTGDVDRYYNKATGDCGSLFRANSYNADAPYQSQWIGKGSTVPYAARYGSFNGETVAPHGCVTLSTLPETGRASPYELALSATYASSAFYGKWPDGNHYHFTGPGDLGLFNVGIPYGNAFFAIDSDDGFRGDYDTFRAGFERLNFSMFSTYDITDNLELYLDVYKNGFFAFDYGNQSGYPYSTYVFAPGQDTPVYIGIDNPYLTANSRDIMSANGLSSMWVSKSHVDLLQKGDGGYTIENRNDTEFFTMGVEGNFALDDNEFLYSAGYSFGETMIYSSAPAVIGARYAAALDVGINPATGEIDCKMNYDPAFNPLNYVYVYGPPTPFFGDQLFGGSILGSPGDCAPLNVMGRGAPSQAARDYVGVDIRQQGVISQEMTFASLSGDIFEMPAGTVGMAIGWEGRVERGDTVYSPITTMSGAAQPNALTRSASRKDVGGSYEIDATYFEVSVPLVGGDFTLPFVDSLVFDFSARNIDNSLAGTYDVEASSLAWRVTDDITVRVSEQTAVKAPNLGDLFLEQVVSYAFARPDPCDFRYRGLGRAPDVRERNCLAEGLAPDFVSIGVNASVQGLSGGNPNLANEIAETEALGLIYQPSWWSDVLFGDLQFSADYIKINLEDYVTSFSLSDNLVACYDFEDYPNKYCDNFTRDADGQLVSWTAGLVNAGLIEFATYIWNADFRTEVSEALSFITRDNVATDLGSLAVRWRAYQQVYFKNAASGNPDDLADTTGEFGNDEWFYDTSFEYSYDKWYAYLAGNSRSGGVIDAFRQYDDEYLGYDGKPITEFKGYTLWDAGIGYRASDDLTFRVIFNNVMDYDGTEDVFDREINLFLVGREVTAAVNWRF